MFRIVGACWCLLVAATALAAGPARPNILWISVEDIGPHLGCYGCEDANTPTLDALAARGVRYTRAFTTCPVCATNRSSIITGVYPTSIGAHHMRCRTTLPSGVRCFPEHLREAGYYCTNNSKTDYNLIDAGKPWDDSSKNAHWRNRTEGQPFFAVFNLTNTHESKVWPRGKGRRRITPDLTAADRLDPDRLMPPPYLPDTKPVRRDWANYLENITQADYDAADLLEQLREDGLEEDTIVFFWSDHGAGLPRNKRWPYDSGVRVPLIVYLPPALRPAGQGVGGAVDDQLISFIDLAPTVLELAGAPLPSYLQGRAFLGADLEPPREYAVSTRDRMDERNDLIRSVRNQRYRYIRNFMPWEPYTQWIGYGERNATMKELRRLAAAGELPEASRLYMSVRKPAEELYDLHRDPHELVNLADNPTLEHREVLARTRAELREWQLATGDLGLIPEPILRQREAELGDCQQIYENPSARQSLQAVLQMLAPARPPAEREADALAELSAEDPVRRYWAVKVVGELPLQPELTPETRRRLASTLEDSAGVVRVAAAAALLRDPDHAAPAALKTLLAGLESPDPWVRHHAALALDDRAGDAPSVVEALRKSLDDPNDYVQRVAKRAVDRAALGE
ncbi:Choline-sulfatase [Posidoniimonas polymericola]|uniref:Choline-sulfatase n=1 Tax=Posidoniimonas polymericola TaxID=2528002 RepID=A0A5C5XU86_9BACT|nr:sulfatase-like hydrolase/transferase [Posidoniimonas polymericola]TWT66866.1 Choline-sulfatase [Posidoniimonas polymericola]